MLHCTHTHESKAVDQAIAINNSSYIAKNKPASSETSMVKSDHFVAHSSPATEKGKLVGSLVVVKYSNWWAVFSVATWPMV